MRCPRCQTQTGPGANVCAACGAPIALGPEPPPNPLRAALPIDRRAGERLSPPPVPRRAVAAPHPPAPAPATVPLAALWTAPGADALQRTAAIRPKHEIHLRRAPTWKRVLAWMLDLAPLVAVGGWIGKTAIGPAPAGGPAIDSPELVLDLLVRERRLVIPLVAFLALVALVHATLGHTLGGATLGKRAIGLRVVARDGRALSWRRSVARSALSLLSGAAFGLGILLAVFTRSGRALHDYLAGTYVVERPRSRGRPAGDGPDEAY